MICDLCGHTTHTYTGMLNPWHQCRECGAQYCDRCSRGQEPDGPSYASPEDLYQVSRSKSCPRCDSPLYKM